MSIKNKKQIKQAEYTKILLIQKSTINNFLSYILQNLTQEKGRKSNFMNKMINRKKCYFEQKRAFVGNIWNLIEIEHYQ